MVGPPITVIIDNQRHKTAGLLQKGGARKERIEVVQRPSGAWPAHRNIGKAGVTVF
jgi:hypothetical protein